MVGSDVGLDEGSLVGYKHDRNKGVENGKHSAQEKCTCHDSNTLTLAVGKTEGFVAIEDKIEKRSTGMLAIMKQMDNWKSFILGHYSHSKLATWKAFP